VHGREPRVSRRLAWKVLMADRQEATATDGVLWIVVLTAEQDQRIADRDLVDAQGDYEEIEAAEWEEEVEAEDEVDIKEIKEMGPQKAAEGMGYTGDLKV